MAVEVDGLEWQVVNTHLGLVPLEQRGQVEALLGPGWTGHPDWRGPAALLGDFNATSRYAAYRRLAARLRDVQQDAAVARPAKTFPSRLPVLRIDHMFLTPDLDVQVVRAIATPLARMACSTVPMVLRSL